MQGVAKDGSGTRTKQGEAWERTKAGPGPQSSAAVQGLVEAPAAKTNPRTNQSKHDQEGEGRDGVPIKTAKVAHTRQ